MTKQVTLKEVASLAGVSYQTVSKVLNRQVQVSPETEERIWQAVNTLGYHPNLIARSMRSQRSRLIGYSWAPAEPGNFNPILDQFLQSMAQAAENQDYHLLAFPYRPGQRWVDAYRELIDTHRVDGFVLSSVEFNDPRLALLQERDFPFVAFGRSNPEYDFPYVDIDGADGMRQVAEHLIGQGHGRIAVLAWPEDSRVGANRMEGLIAALEQAGLSLAPELLKRGEGVYDFGRQAARQLLDLPALQRPTAIIAFNDVMAIGAMHAVQERGLQAGTDIAITGFDDSPMIQYLSPALTSVRQPIWQVGQEVMARLVCVLDEQQAEMTRQTLLKPQLIVRASSTAIK